VLPPTLCQHFMLSLEPTSMFFLTCNLCFFPILASEKAVLCISFTLWLMLALVLTGPSLGERTLVCTLEKMPFLLKALTGKYPS
jgi:hypothetical protein